jgi:hypothetical protein
MGTYRTFTNESGRPRKDKGSDMQSSQSASLATKLWGSVAGITAPLHPEKSPSRLRYRTASHTGRSTSPRVRGEVGSRQRSG